jgi:hypothetical protein
VSDHALVSDRFRLGAFHVEQRAIVDVVGTICRQRLSRYNVLINADRIKRGAAAATTKQFLASA